jgi:hypothetical protein
VGCSGGVRVRVQPGAGAGVLPLPRCPNAAPARARPSARLVSPAMTSPSSPSSPSLKSPRMWRPTSISTQRAASAASSAATPPASACRPFHFKLRGYQLCELRGAAAGSGGRRKSPYTHGRHDEDKGQLCFSIQKSNKASEKQPKGRSRGAAPGALRVRAQRCQPQRLGQKHSYMCATRSPGRTGNSGSWTCWPPKFRKTRASRRTAASALPARRPWPMAVWISCSTAPAAVAMLATPAPTARAGLWGAELR